MFSSLGTKLALKKLGVPKDVTNMGSPFGGGNDEPKKSKKNQRSLTADELDEAEGTNWPKWMTVKNLPLTVQPWLSPPPPPVPVAAECPGVGSLAPIDRDRKLALGNNGRKVLVVFLRCVGCACELSTCPGSLAQHKQLSQHPAAHLFVSYPDEDWILTPCLQLLKRTSSRCATSQIDPRSLASPCPTRHPLPPASGST